MIGEVKVSGATGVPIETRSRTLESGMIIWKLGHFVFLHEELNLRLIGTYLRLGLLSAMVRSPSNGCTTSQLQFEMFIYTEQILHGSSHHFECAGGCCKTELWAVIPGAGGWKRTGGSWIGELASVLAFGTDAQSRPIAGGVHG